MELTKRPGKNSGFYITLEIGNRSNESWWGAPPDNIDHVDLSYLNDRYPLITTEKRVEEFKKLWKDLWKNADTPMRLVIKVKGTHTPTHCGTSSSIQKCEKLNLNSERCTLFKKKLEYDFDAHACKRCKECLEAEQ